MRSFASLRQWMALALLGSAGLLSGCGGGGGGGLPLSLALSPASVTASFFQDDIHTFVVTATVTGTVNDDVVAVIRVTSDIDSAVDISQVSVNSYEARFRTVRGLPAGTRSGTIEVSVCSNASCSKLYGRASLPYTFNVLVPPRLSSLGPDNAVAGAGALTLRAIGEFDSGAAILWDGVARSTTFVSATELTTLLSESDLAVAGTHSVAVRTERSGGRTSAARSFVVRNPVASIASISPDQALQGGPALTVTVDGTNFVASSTVRWNGSDRETSYVSPTQLTAVIREEDLAVGGANAITVFNPAPGGGASAPVSFTTNYPVPLLSLINAKSAKAGCGEFLLAVAGDGFSARSTVLWNGSARPTTALSRTVLQARIAAADIATVGTTTVTVSNPTPGGGTSGSASFRIQSEGAANSEAVSYLINPEHNSVATTECPVSLPAEESWTREFPTRVSYPLVAEGRVLVSDQSGKVYGLDAGTGAQVWGATELRLFGASYEQGTVFLVGSQPTCCDGVLKAYRMADGMPKYSIDLPSRQSFAPATTARDGLLHVAAGQSSVAFDQSNGSVVWLFGSAGIPESVPVATASGVYLRQSDDVIALDPAAGTQNWRYFGNSSGDAGVTSTVVDGVVYSMTAANFGRGIKLSEADGTVLGTFAASIPPVVGAQLMYLVRDSQLHAVRRSDDSAVWSFAPAQQDYFFAAPVLVNEVLFIASAGGRLYALDAATGLLLWTKQLPGPFESVYRFGIAMAVGNGYLMVPSGNILSGFAISSRH